MRLAANALKCNRRILLPVVVVLVVGYIWQSTHQLKDIKYQGKWLNEYVSELPPTYPRFCAFEPEQEIKDSEALAAIRANGTNCFPILFTRLIEQPVFEEKLRWRLNFLISPQTAEAWDERLHSLMKGRWQVVTAVTELQRSGCDMRSFIERLERFKQSPSYQGRTASAHDVQVAVEFLWDGLTAPMSTGVNLNAPTKGGP